MRKATNVVTKKKRIGTHYCPVRLPLQGEVIDLGGTTLTAISPVKIKKTGELHEAQFSLDAGSHNVRLTINIVSSNPFKIKTD